MNLLSVLILVLSLFAIGSAQADVLGLSHGRLADLDERGRLSVQAGYNYHSDVNHVGARVNLRLSASILLFGDFGEYTLSGEDVDLSNVSGTSQGFGLMYQSKVTDDIFVGMRAVFHTAEVSVDDCAGAFCSRDDLTEMAVGWIASGERLGSLSLGWYVNVGSTVLDQGAVATSESNFGGGFGGSLSLMDWHLGVDYIDEFYVVTGVRFNLF